MYDSCPPGTICRSGVWWKTLNTGSVAGPRHCITCSAIARMPLPTVGTWRHNQVLREVCEAAKAAVSKANSRTIANQRKIYFLREGFAHLCRKRCQTPRRDILAEANDWTVAADLEWMRNYPLVLIESGKRPDSVLVSSSTDDIILVELTVPWEDRLQYSNALEADKYADLSMDLEAKGYRTDLFPIDVGAKGVVGRSTYAFSRRLDCRAEKERKL